MRIKLPLKLVLFLGLLGFTAYFMPHPIVRQTEDLMLYKILRIIGLFAIVLGLGSLFVHHWDRIKRRRERWQYSVVMFVCFFGSAVIGIFGGMDGEGPLVTRVGSFSFDIQHIFDYMTVPLGATMFSLLAFYMSSAAYRAFRVRNFASGLLLGAAFIVMLGVVPLGDMLPMNMIIFGLLAFAGLYFSIRAFMTENYRMGITLAAGFAASLVTAFLLRNVPLSSVSQWIMEIPNTASKRGIAFGVSVGIIATSIKIILGIERSWLGGNE